MKEQELDQNKKQMRKSAEPDQAASGPYDDIIDLPHHQSRVHPRMPEANRAAQFAPFAALTGYGEAIDETGIAFERSIE